MIDREDERDWLRSRLDDGRQLLVIYGRRRVGKTTLVTDVLEQFDTPSASYLCDERGTESNARDFAEQCAATFDNVPPAVDDFTHYEAEAPSSRSAGLPTGRKHKRVGRGGSRQQVC